MHPHLILASSSQYRKKLLERLNIPFDVISANIDEACLKNEIPEDLAKRLSIDKAKAVTERNPESWVIGSDQIAVLTNQRTGQQEILGKPGNKEKATEQLKACSAQELSFITGICLSNTKMNKNLYANSIVKVKFLSLTEKEIKNYLKTEKPFDCAGSFKVEGLGISLFEWVKSEDPTSLEGLPLINLCKLLRQAGFQLL